MSAVAVTNRYVQDALLVDRCLQGEQAAARQLFRDQHRRVQATLWRVIGHNRDMDDLLQDVFLEVFRSLRRYRAEATLATWIDRIAARVAYRYLRSRKKLPTLLESLPEPVAEGVSPAARATARHRLDRFFAAAAELPPAARIAYVLHVVEGRPVAEVATLTDATVTATKVRVWRARRLLRKRAARDPVLGELLAEQTADPAAREGGTP